MESEFSQIISLLFKIYIGMISPLSYPFCNRWSKLTPDLIETVTLHLKVSSEKRHPPSFFFRCCFFFASPNKGNVRGGTVPFGGRQILTNEKDSFTTLNFSNPALYIFNVGVLYLNKFTRHYLRPTGLLALSAKQGWQGWQGWQRLPFSSHSFPANFISSRAVKAERRVPSGIPSGIPSRIPSGKGKEQLQPSKIWTGKLARNKGKWGGSGPFSAGAVSAVSEAALTSPVSAVSPVSEAGLTRLTRLTRLTELKRKKVGVISITATGNNTLFTLSDGKGKLRGSVSAGSVGFRNSGKSALAGAERGAARIVNKAQESGFQLLRVEMRGIGYTKLKALRAMIHTPVPILEIVEKTTRSHNGCRLPRKRRL